MKQVFHLAALAALCAQAALAQQALISTVDRNLSSAPIVYAADVAPGGIIGYNEQTKEIFYEGRSDMATSLSLATDATYPFPQEVITKSRSVDIGLSFFGIPLSAGFHTTGQLEISGGEFTVHRYDLNAPRRSPGARYRKPFDLLVFTDPETIDTAYDGYLKWKHWNAFLIEAVYKTKSLTITQASSLGIKLSNGDTPPDCSAPVSIQRKRTTQEAVRLRKLEL